MYIRDTFCFRLIPFMSMGPCVFGRRIANPFTDPRELRAQRGQQGDLMAC